MIVEFAKSLWRRIAQQPPVSAPAVAPPATRAGRPVSATMTRAMAAVGSNPSITAPELAALLHVTPSYGRTLLRRARSRQAESPIQAVRASDVQLALSDLQQRLSAAEKDLASVRAMPVHARASLNLNRRAEVLRLLGSGAPPDSVAERLAIPPGEVDFILKIDRVLAASA